MDIFLRSIIENPLLLEITKLGVLLEFGNLMVSLSVSHFVQQNYLYLLAFSSLLLFRPLLFVLIDVCNPHQLIFCLTLL